MRRLLCLIGICLAFGCAPSDTGTPATPDNTTSQIEAPAGPAEAMLQA